MIVTFLFNTLNILGKNYLLEQKRFKIYVQRLVGQTLNCVLWVEFIKWFFLSILLAKQFDALKVVRWSRTFTFIGLGKAKMTWRSTLNPSTAVCKVWQSAPVVLSPRNYSSPEHGTSMISVSAPYFRAQSFESRKRDRITWQAVPHFPDNPITLPSNRPTTPNSYNLIYHSP